MIQMVIVSKATLVSKQLKSETYNISVLGVGNSLLPTLLLLTALHIQVTKAPYRCLNT